MKIDEEISKPKDVSWENLKFWAGQTPPKEYFEPVDPYRSRDTTCFPTLNHLELSRYLKKPKRRRPSCPVKKFRHLWLRTRQLT